MLKSVGFLIFPQLLRIALQEMEVAQQNLKEFALRNSALAQENFISDSLKLDEIRMEQRKVYEISELLSLLYDMIKIWRGRERFV